MDTYNNNTIETEEISSDNSVNHDIYLGFTIVLFFIGLFGNILIIIAYTLYKKLRSHATTFVVNTAVADICVGVLGDVFIIVGVATSGEFLKTNRTLCVFSSYLCASVCIVSVWSIAAASFNGYVRVCHTASYDKIFTRITMPIIIVVLWAAGILILFPTLFGWGDHYYDDVLKFCIPSSTASWTYTYFMVFAGWGIPLVVILYSFGRIIYTVRKSSRIMRRHSTKSQKTDKSSFKGSVKDKSGGKKSRPDHALIRSVFIIAFYFFAAYGFLLIILLMGDNYGGSLPSVVFAVVLAHTHCTFSGILFAGTNQRFRNAYANMFCCISEKQAASDASTGSSTISSRLSRLSRSSKTAVSQQVLCESGVSESKT